MHVSSAPVRPSLRRATLAAVRLPAAEAILGARVKARAASMNSLRVMAASSLQFRCRMIVGSLRGKDTILPFSPLLTDFNVDEFEQGLGEGKTGTRPSNEDPHLSNRQTGLLTRWTEPCRGARPPATVLDCARLTRWLQHRFDGDCRITCSRCEEVSWAAEHPCRNARRRNERPTRAGCWWST